MSQGNEKVKRERVCDNSKWAILSQKMGSFYYKYLDKLSILYFHYYYTVGF